MKTFLRINMPLLLLGWMLSCSVQAEVYRWVDGDGNVHFADRSPQQPAEKLELDSYKAPEAPAVSQAGPRVTMYATPTCPVCQRAREYFASNGVSYREYDLDSDQDALLRYNELKGGGIPLILVGEKRLDGFSEPAFAAIYTPE